MHESMEAKKHVVVLGAGRVAAPLVEYLHRDSSIDITVACEIKNLCDNLARSFPGIQTTCLNVAEDHHALEEIVKKADVVVCILPTELQLTVAQTCIKQGTHMVTASYLSESLKALHQEALDAGITVLNEIGLDPGIDHLLALECIQEVQSFGGKVTSFVSFCGGLPAPEFSDNPLRYKFSWSPRGALLNTLSPARYLKNGKIVEISAGGALMDSVKSLDFLPGFNLEGFPNRDSTIYTKYYGIEDALTVLRGTIRYTGSSKATRILQYLGLLNPEPLPILHKQGPEITWRMLICTLLGLENHNIPYDDLKKQIVAKTGFEFCIDVLEELGLLDDKVVTKCGSPLDTLTHYLSIKLAFEKDERDLVILRHEIGIHWPNDKKETRSINFVVYGDVNGYSAMAKTVGYPVAIATKMILDGEIQQRGMILPFAPEIYKTILLKLRAEGLNTRETSKFY